MKKRVMLSFLLVMLAIALEISFVFAANETGYEKGYACLEFGLGDNCAGTKSTEQAAFSLLAASYKSSLESSCKDNLMQKKQQDCFGASDTATCDIKSTAQAIIALDNIDADTKAYVDWILSKKKYTSGLNWFLEIDANEEAKCVIKADEEAERTFTISADKKVSGSSSCLSPAENNYFLKINDKCFSKNFSISCNKDFITSLLYKKSADNTYYVSSKTHSAPADGTTQEAITSFCFGLSGCDYEGSLWAVAALSRLNEEVSPYLPYLTSAESENEKKFPSAFLLMLTGEDDYYSQVIEKQKQGKYWDESGSKFYDTPLALLALGNYVTEEVENAKDYLLEIQDASGCWHSGNIRDTAFILFSAWPKKPATGTTTPSLSNCEDFNFFCLSSSECSVSDTVDNFYCPALSDICCKTQPEEQACLEKGGLICTESQECTGSKVPASDTSYCCLASCVDITPPTPECETYGYSCSLSCNANTEEEKSYSCNNLGEKCCGAKTVQPSKFSWWIIVLLAILIILVILAIIYRNQLSLWIFKMKSKFSEGKAPKPTQRPGFGPGPPVFTRPMPPPPQRGPLFSPRPAFRPPLRPMPPAKPQEAPKKGPGRPARKEPEEKDKDFEETMKKLRDMSK